MPRNIPASLITALTKPEIQPFFAIELMFDPRQYELNGETIVVGPLRLWTGMHDRTITVRGQEQAFTGSGGLLGIGGIEEIGDLTAKNIVLTLSGISSEMIALALKEPYQRRLCRLYFGTEEAADVLEIFSGKMNTMQIQDESESSVITLSVESRLVELNQASNWRYTDQSFKARNPNDTFFSRVQSIQDVQVSWGRKSG